MNGENGWFPFGTACSKENEKSFCVTGKCLEFGKDDTPLHESIFSLPLLSRYKRATNEIRNSQALDPDNDFRRGESQFLKEHSSARFRRNLEHDKTMIISQLNQEDLDSIIFQLNLSGQLNYRPNHTPFQIDLNNPIHIPIDQFDDKFYNYT